jgi:hypothetical protein
MSDAEKIDSIASVEGVRQKREQQPASPARLAKLPLEALLYYVLYGDEELVRLRA